MDDEQIIEKIEKHIEEYNQILKNLKDDTIPMDEIFQPITSLLKDIVQNILKSKKEATYFKGIGKFIIKNGRIEYYRLYSRHSRQITNIQLLNKLSYILEEKNPDTCKILKELQNKLSKHIRKMGEIKSPILNEVNKLKKIQSSYLFNEHDTIFIRPIKGKVVTCSYDNVDMYNNPYIIINRTIESDYMEYNVHLININKRNIETTSCNDSSSLVLLNRDYKEGLNEAIEFINEDIRDLKEKAEELSRPYIHKFIKTSLFRELTMKKI